MTNHRDHSFLVILDIARRLTAVICKHVVLAPHGRLRLRIAVALGLLLSCLIGSMPDAALAQDQPSAGIQHLLEEKAYDIPPQPLGSALNEFAETSGLQVSFPSDLAAGRNTVGIVGRYTPEKALEALLVGTGLTHRYVNANTVTLQRGQDLKGPQASADERGDMSLENRPRGGETNVSKTIQVQEILVRESPVERDYFEPEEFISTRIPVDRKDVPVVSNIVTRQVFEDQKAIRLDQALRNVSGVFATNFGSFFDPIPICRGFECGFFKNVLRQDKFRQARLIEVANIQRLEVLKGPPSVLYGRSEPGGIVNVMTKQPLQNQYYAADMIIGSYNLYRPTVDVSGPLNSSKTLLYRFNGAYESSESFRDFVFGNRMFAAPVFTWKLGSRTVLTFEGEYLRDRRFLDRGLVASGDRPAPIPLSRQLGERFNEVKTQDGRAGFFLTHQFNETWSLLSVFRADYNGQESFDVGLGALDPDGRTLNRFLLRTGTQFSSYYWRNDLVAKLSTGPIRHTLLTGFELGRESFYSEEGFTGATSIDIFNPVYGTQPRVDLPPAFIFNTMFQSAGFYVQDHVELLDNLKVLGGVRYDIFRQRQNTVGFGGSPVQTQEDMAFSPRVGLVYQPIRPISLYANYTRSFVPLLGVTASGAAFNPSRGTQYEVGVKSELIPNRLFATLAFYRILRDNLTTPDPATFGIFTIQTGEQKSRGIELDISGQITPSWNIIATYAYTDAEVANDNTFAVGNRLPNVALHSGSLWTTYQILEGALKGWGVGGGIFAAGERVGDLNNTLELPGYVRADAALYYRKPNFYNRTNLYLALNVRNIFDKEYYAATDGFRGSILPGEPLTFLASLKLEYY